MKILITGTAGFIASHLFKRLEADGHELTGIDNINSYYDVLLKYERLRECGFSPETIREGECVFNAQNNRFIKLDLNDRKGVADLFANNSYDYVCHLAAQPGVRYSIQNPYAYIDSNIFGFLNVIEGAHHAKVKHFFYASSSSVYGLNSKIPFNENDRVDHPISLYATTKKSNELIAHCYSYIHKLPVTGLRFFTVYGPWGRPDMALYKFVKSILNGENIDVYNNGDMQRDFTYIDDIIEGVCRVIYKSIQTIQSSDKQNNAQNCIDPSLPYRIYNIGNGKPVALMDFISAIEKSTGKKAKINFKPSQAGDVPITWADTSALHHDFDYVPSTSIEEGVEKFVNWYQHHYNIRKN
jgi:UDP-glucuronate 4-epimerase